MGLIEIETNLDAVARDFDRIADAIPTLILSASARIRENIRSILVETFYLAVQEAGEGFPAQYTHHLAEGISNLAIEVVPEGDSVVIRVTDLEELGGYNDLERGFHYHALAAVDKENFSTSAPELVELPYEGQELYNPDVKIREDFWKAIVEGISVDVLVGKPPRPLHIETAGLYAETMAARVAEWESTGVYPEWLLLEYGTVYDPIIPPTHLRALIIDKLTAYGEEIMSEIASGLEDAVTESDIGINSAGRPYNINTGRFVRYLEE